MAYVRSAELVTPSGGVILSATAESLNNTTPGGLIDPSVATQHNVQRLRIYKLLPSNSIKVDKPGALFLILLGAAPPDPIIGSSLFKILCLPLQ